MLPPRPAPTAQVRAPALRVPVSPRGDVVAFERGGQVWAAPVDGSSPAKALFTARGSNGDVEWSPDGSRLAFVSNRGDHAFIGVYTNAAAPIQWVEPSTGRDAMPRWSPDGKRLVFVRRPGAGGSPQTILDPHPTAWSLWAASAATGEGQELERRTLFLTSLLEPLLILTMGVVVLLIVLAVLMPIIEINQLVR